MLILFHTAYYSVWFIGIIGDGNDDYSACDYDRHSTNANRVTVHHEFPKHCGGWRNWRNEVLLTLKFGKLMCWIGRKAVVKQRVSIPPERRCRPTVSAITQNKGLAMWKSIPAFSSDMCRALRVTEHLERYGEKNWSEHGKCGIPSRVQETKQWVWTANKTLWWKQPKGNCFNTWCSTICLFCRSLELSLSSNRLCTPSRREWVYCVMYDFDHRFNNIQR